MDFSIQQPAFEPKFSQNPNSSSYEVLSLLQKNEELNFRLLSSDSQLHSAKASIQQAEDWKTRYNEQKLLIQSLHISNDDLRNRLQISLQTNAELTKKYQEEVNSINSHRIMEINSIKTILSSKENEYKDLVLKLQQKIKKLEQKNFKIQQIYKIKIEELEKDKKDESTNPNKPFCIQIASPDPNKDNEINKRNELKKNKWKNKYLKEKQKKNQLKDTIIKEMKVEIENKQRTIDNFKFQLDEKQNSINLLKQQQSESSTQIINLKHINQSHQQNQEKYLKEIERLEKEKSFHSQENFQSFVSEQSEIYDRKIETLKSKLGKALKVVEAVTQNNDLLEQKVQDQKKNNKSFKRTIMLMQKEKDNYNEELTNIKDLIKDKDKIIKKLTKKIKMNNKANPFRNNNNDEKLGNRHVFSSSSFSSNSLSHYSNLHSNPGDGNIDDKEKQRLNNGSILSHSKEENSVNENTIQNISQNFEIDSVSKDSKLIDHLNSIIKSLRSELQQMIQEKSRPIIPFDLLPSELLTEISDKSNHEEESVIIACIIKWYNQQLQKLKYSESKLKVVEKHLFATFKSLNLDFSQDMEVNLKQIDNYLDSLKDQLREIKLKEQQLHLEAASFQSTA